MKTNSVDTADTQDSQASRAQRHLAAAQLEAGTVPGIATDTPVLAIGSVGIIGAGTMGGGIAMNFLNAGIPVTLVETSREALNRGIGIIRRNYENSAARGRITQDQVDACMALITPVLELDALAGVDLVIEAVFENLALKKTIFQQLDRICRPGAILATNTSFLDVDQIASVTSRPDWILGLHFFSPANVMRLLEIVRGARTSREVIATAMALARKIGKVAVLSGVCHGFIANRVMATRSVQADALILEGTDPADVDRAMRDYGFAMGPFQLADLVGLDVIASGSSGRTVAGDLVTLGRLGQKKNGGYYDYDDKRNATASPIAAGVIADAMRARGVERRAALSPEDILARLLYPVVNEGVRLLEEGVALRASDIDVALTLGYSWPAQTGGPMFWADTVGLSRIVADMDALRGRFGDSFEPTPLLRRLAVQGARLTQD
ncbi:3-hydroxyacyl-CoA dehydrogenase [Povalibacter sp.]|uniref:3-hydroxyacyl-CoA dehydrogenase n=1 Tax=Povalibacter sp. TaxID=1962978 RepID=UPI002F425E76